MSLDASTRLRLLQAMGLLPLRRRPPPLARLQISGAVAEDLQRPEWKLVLQALGINAQRCTVQAAESAQIALSIGGQRVLMSTAELRSLRSHPARKREWWSQLRPLRRALHSDRPR
ncbi:MAG TPA: hypothetical protein PK027_09440 [Aquimonas sp.]|nr:hypothetical protein [Xanthomonadales bacterium]HRD72547.1 hypothetical protein [Aquimonas sp.]HRF54666.1 hypothetical protein [Aquimonas sp.]